MHRSPYLTIPDLYVFRFALIVTITWFGCDRVMTSADETPAAEERTNLAAGRTVVFSPTPNYALTARGESDPTDLTDGKTTSREDRCIWFESGSVGWSYGGRVNLAVDLGRQANIDEVAIRLLGGSPQPGVNFPVWIEAFTSDDGEHWQRVEQCSRWNKDDFARFGVLRDEGKAWVHTTRPEASAYGSRGVPRDEGKAWVHCLRFRNLRASGRWVGLRMVTCGLSCCDELYVFGSPAKQEIPVREAAAADFTVTRPQPYLHKPYAVLATNLAGPLPVGMIVPPDSSAGDPVVLTIETPASVELLGGHVGDVVCDKTITEKLGDGGSSYRFEIARPKNAKDFGRLYAQASGWRDGQTGAMRYRFSQGDWQSPVVSVPIRAVEVPKAPRLKELMVGMGWWSAGASAKWPGVLDAWEQLGLNTFPLFAHWMKESDPLWSLVEEARDRGFFIASIDSPIHRMISAHANDAEIYEQLPDGETSKKLCISYRGPHYQREIDRYAQSMARARPDFASADIEVWNWRGPIDSKRCERCQADFEASGHENWAAWQVSKGDEIWRNLVEAARTETAKVHGPICRIGGYDFRPGPAYQSVWSVDHNYPQWMHGSQVSTYSCLYPYHWQLIGDEVRRDRDALGHNDVMPWITPGDAGTFPGEALQWTLLECYCNGARGVYFWSSRVWDIESLIAYNRVVRAIAPVERIILEGKPLGDAWRVDPPARLSGLRLDNSAVLLLADYTGRTKGTLTLNLDLPVQSRLVDLLTGEVLRRAADEDIPPLTLPSPPLSCCAGGREGTFESAPRLATDLPAGPQRIQVPLDGLPARLLHVIEVQ